MFNLASLQSAIALSLCRVGKSEVPASPASTENQDANGGKGDQQTGQEPKEAISRQAYTPSGRKVPLGLTLRQACERLKEVFFDDAYHSTCVDNNSPIKVKRIVHFKDNGTLQDGTHIYYI